MVSMTTSDRLASSIEPTRFLEDLRGRKTAIAVIGLGYVGLPLAVALAKKFKVIGFDISRERVADLKRHRDPSCELSSDELQAVELDYTSDASELKKARFIIVAVPTPIDDNKNPDLTPLELASESIGRNLASGTVVCFESTVYPGVTEDVCGPAIEAHSSLRCGRDFFLAYSPERINPGDRERTIDKITKIVSGQTPEVLEVVAQVYGAVVSAGIHRAGSIRIAEAAKVIENAQRDINIAFVNELSIIFDKMGIDTREVLQAARTKWNFLDFRPGLVGGHCIGVDPYYLTFKAQSLGHVPQTILSGRRINDGMGRWIGRKLVKSLIECDKHVRGAKILVCGLTFKENVTDTRNSKVRDIIDELRDYHVDVVAWDPNVSPEEARAHFDVRLVEGDALHGFDGIVVAVAHREFRELSPEALSSMVKTKPAPFFDLKWMFEREPLEAAGFRYWRL